MQSLSASTSPNNSTRTPSPAPTPEEIASSGGGSKDGPPQPQPASRSAPFVPTPFALPTDAEWLAPPVCLLKEQLEVFAATPQDVAEKKSGAKPLLGTVGLRCRHCADDPNKSKGGVMFPKSISLVHQAVRNFQRYHFYSCPKIPEEVKAKMKSFKPKQAQSKRNANQYWVDSCRDVFGMVDAGVDVEPTESNDGEKKKAPRSHIRFRDGWGYEQESLMMAKADDGQDPSKERSFAPASDALDEPSAPTGYNEEPIGQRLGALSDGSEHGIEGVEFDERIDCMLKDVVGRQSQDSDSGGDASGASSVAAVAEPSIASGADDTGKRAKTNIIPVDHRRLSIRATLPEPVGNFNCSSGELGVDTTNLLLDMLAGTTGEEQFETSSADIGLQRSQGMETIPTTDLTQPASMSSGAHLSSTNSCVAGIPTEGDSASLASIIRNQQIVACQTVLGRVQTAKQSNSRPNLAEIGRMIYRTFVGDEPLTNTASLGQTVRNEDRRTSSSIEETRESFACAALESDNNSECSSAVGATGGIAHHKRQKNAIHTASKRGPAFAPRLEALERKMQEADLPVQLDIMISSLINADDAECADRYCSIEELEVDLFAMVADPDRHLFDIPVENQTGRLFDHHGQKLYGREVQQKQLAGPFQRVLQNGGPREAVYISGVSGTGKSSLVHDQISSSIHSLNGRVISGKFDALRQRQPCEVVCQALDDFCRSLATSADRVSAILRTSIANVIDAEGLGALSGVMPSLQNLLPPELAQQARFGRRSSGLDGVNQLFYHLNLFIAAISSAATPILFFFDDIQWCDAAAFDIFTRIVSERSLSSFLFVGCYRDDEVSELHPLQKHRRDLLDAGVFTGDVTLGAFDKSQSNEMISDLLHLPKRITQPLADCVSTKTSGNILFLKQFLLSLCDEGLLYYSASARRWHWDTETIQRKDVTDSVADLLTSKIIGLDSRAQDLLKLVACLGFECKGSTLSKLDVCANSDLMEKEMLLKILTNEGMLSRVGDDIYKFPHEKIEHAAYNLIRPCDRAEIHLRIGRQLRRTTATAMEFDSLLFTIIDQLARGLDKVTDHNEKIEIARLCLMAGKKAMMKSSAGPASIYFLQGTTLLQESDWENNYDLSLDLFTCCVEAQFVTCNFDGVHISHQPIDHHARSILDKLPSFSNVISTLNAQGRFEDAVDAGLTVLSSLGENFKKDVTREDMLVELQKVKILLDSSLAGKEGVSINEILAKAPSIVDNTTIDKEVADKKVAAMKLIAQLTRTSYQYNQFLQYSLHLRSIHISMSYGLCQYSIGAFASYGIRLALRHMKIDEANSFGKLSLNLIDRFDAIEEMPRIYAIAFSYIFPCVRPVQSLIPELRRAYDVAMRSGSLEVAMQISRQISHLLLSCDGMAGLEKASEEIQEYFYQMKKHKEEIMGSCLPVLQYFLILMGDGGEDPSILCGRVMSYENSFKEALSRGDLMTILEINSVRIRLFYLFGKYDEAGTLVKDFLRMQQRFPSSGYHADILGDSLYFGLTATVLACSNPHDADEWTELAESTLKKFEVFARHSEWNFAHRVELMKAEIAYFIQYDNEGALAHYREAIDLAGKHKFPGERALALERTAMFCEGSFRADLARSYYKQAEKTYREWGATRKADLLAIACDCFAEDEAEDSDVARRYNES